nr:SHOCT domain-containing protein [Candidatus Sigynarchaeum springense]MDO8116337.1 SHOCT domain-containing protein [Candidatus Sigynarchaeota archaeon]
MEINDDVLKKFKGFLITLIVCLVSLPSFIANQRVDYYFPSCMYGWFTVPFFIFGWGFFSPSSYVGFGRAYYSEYSAYCGGWITASFPAVVFYFIVSIGIMASSLVIFVRSLVLLNKRPEEWNLNVKSAGIYSLVVGIVMNGLSLFDGFPLPNSLNGIIMIIFGAIILGLHHKLEPRPEIHSWSLPPSTPSVSQVPSSSSLSILKERLARGEITEDEFLRKKTLLGT